MVMGSQKVWRSNRLKYENVLLPLPPEKDGISAMRAKEGDNKKWTHQKKIQERVEKEGPKNRGNNVLNLSPLNTSG